VAAGIGWPLPEGVGEEELEAKLFGNQPVQAAAMRQRSQPDWSTIHQQLQQHRHLTLQLVWEEYRQAHPEGYRYSWFCIKCASKEPGEDDSSNGWLCRTESI
jgi:transposase